MSEFGPIAGTRERLDSKIGRSDSVRSISSMPGTTILADVDRGDLN